MKIPANIPIIGQTAPINGNLSNVEVESELTTTFNAVCTVRADGEYEGRPVHLVGQLPPQELKALGLRWLEMAIDIANDARFAQEMAVTAGAPPRVVMGLVGRVHARREQQAVPDDWDEREQEAFQSGMEHACESFGHRIPSKEPTCLCGKNKRNRQSEA